MSELVGFCLNSRRYVDFMWLLPKSCPSKGWQGNTFCEGENCSYYEERAPSMHYKRKMKLMREFEQEFARGKIEK